MAAKPQHPLVRDFLASHRLDWSEHHLYNATIHLNRFTRWLAAEGVELAAADKGHCATFLEARRAVLTPHSSTLVKDYQFLKWLFAWLADEGELDGRDPMARMKGPGQPAHDPRRTPHVTEASYARLMASFDKRKTLDRRNAAICSLMYRCGARGIDACRADLDRLDLDNARLEVIGKSGQWEVIQLAAETCRMIERYLRRREGNGPALFIGSRGTRAGDGRLTTQAIAEMLERRGKQLGIHVPVHSFRRGMAINGKQNGMNDTTVQHVGRWKDPRMVARYQRNAQAELAAAEFHAKDPTARRTPPPRKRLRAVG
jgi:site-specific recombinase XerD